MKLIILSIPAACLGLSACALKTPPSGSAILTDAARGQIPAGWSGAHQGGTMAPGWIGSFGDPGLTRIVNNALKWNPDLRAAAARVEASQAAVRVAAASLYPRIAVKTLGEFQGQKLDGDIDLGLDPPSLGGLGVDNTGGSPGSRSAESSSQRWVAGIGVGASWEADVWGRVRSKRAAAAFDSGALSADYEFARQSLAATVARAYFSSIEAAQQAVNAEETLGLYRDYLKLAEILKTQGHASDFDLAQIKSRSAGVEDSLYVAQAARAQAIRAIEVVTSHYPAGRLTPPASFPGQPKYVPSGLPAQILERRPDIIAAERRFAAAFHRVNEARTARLPRFSLSTSGGLGTAQLSGVGTLDALSWSLAGGVVQPIFFGGELKAAEEIRTAEQRAAAASYTATVLHAFGEVEGALASEYYLNKRAGALAGMVEQAGVTVKLGKLQFDEGHADMFTLLRLAGESLAAKIELTKIRASLLRERVNLHLALGGDFQEAVERSK
ncbi:MAG: efflux system, outer rane lipoprotein NodT family [Verrucomicrobiales bacterium]|nr:efflux system, outer rane lipoprotein NodT family [Verrucomicrobiales bacterium]